MAKSLIQVFCLLPLMIPGVPGHALGAARSSEVVFRELRSWLDLHGDTHVYPGARLRDDFFCLDPMDCSDARAEGPPVNPLLDRLAGLADEFVVAAFTENLGGTRSYWSGLTSTGERCVLDAAALHLSADIDGEPHEDFVRLDWNDSGDWTRFRVRAVRAGSFKMISQPSWWDRFAQRILTRGPSAEQRFGMQVLGPGRIQISLRVNHARPRDLLDWRRKRVVCEFVR
jgi:hypothetical protein